MDDDRRREANQRNAQKSTGPRTTAGKARSSRNATRHGLLSRRMLLQGESEKELAALRQGMRQSLRPFGELEEELVERMVATTWRKRRGDRVELGLWDWRGTVSRGESTLANVFFMDSQHDQSLQKLTRYMTACSAEFRRAYQMLREAQAARQEQANGAEWTDLEADAGRVEEEGLEEGAEDEEDGPDDDPTGGSSGTPASASVTEAQVKEFALGPDWMTREKCSPPRPEVDPRDSGESGRRDTPDRRRWQDLSTEEQMLFMVRNKDQVLAVNEIIDEVLFDRQWVERMTVPGLLRASTSLNSMIWQTTLGIDKLIEQEERKGH